MGGHNCHVSASPPSTIELAALAVSVLALVISAITLWWTALRSGTVKMTRPTTICLDHNGLDPSQNNNKVFLRTLLFATSKRGRVIESLHVSLSRNETRQNFSIWVYGSERLQRGSGLFVSESGVEANHHFLCPPDGSRFEFLAGAYRLDVYCQVLGDRRRTHLFSQTIRVSESEARALQKPRTGLYFDWSPDSGEYLSHVRTSDLPPGAEDYFPELLQEDAQKEHE